MVDLLDVMSSPSTPLRSLGKVPSLVLLSPPAERRLLLKDPGTVLLGEGVPCDLIEHLFPPTESCLYTVSGSSQSQGMRECDCMASGPQLPEEAQKEPCPSM